MKIRLNSPSAQHQQISYKQLLEPSNPKGIVKEKNFLSPSESGDNSFTEFDEAKWLMGVKVSVCGNKNTLDVLSVCIRGLDAIRPSKKIELANMDNGKSMVSSCDN